MPRFKPYKCLPNQTLNNDNTDKYKKKRVSIAILIKQLNHIMYLFKIESKCLIVISLQTKQRVNF